MTNIATEAGWSLEQSYEVARFQSRLSSQFIHSGMTVRQMIDEVKDSEFNETDKLFVALVLGVFMAKNLGVFD